MKKIARYRYPALSPFDMAELAFTSAETIARRSWLMATGMCSPTEYQQMVAEKFAAACDSAFALAFSPGHRKMSAALAPWQRRARANAQRLRKRKRK